MKRKTRRSQAHPILREITKRQREIAKLLAAARLIGLDTSSVTKPALSPAEHKTARVPKAELRRRLREAMAPTTPPPTRRRKTVMQAAGEDVTRLLLG